MHYHIMSLVRQSLVRGFLHNTLGCSIFIVFVETAPEFYNVSEIDYYLFPYQIKGITVTSQGDLAIVGPGPRAAICSTQGQIKMNINIPGAGKLIGVARLGQVLYINQFDTGLIHVVQESGVYVNSINTGLTKLIDIALNGDTIWVTDQDKGLYKITIDSSFSIVNQQLLASPSSSFRLPRGIAVYGNRVIVACHTSHNLHIFDMVGNRVVPPVGGFGSGDGQFYNPNDVTTDLAGRIYVGDYNNDRIVLLSPTGQFLRTLAQSDFGIGVATVWVDGNTLYSSTYTYPNYFRYLIVMKLI